jgi:hypothetical protein
MATTQQSPPPVRKDPGRHTERTVLVVLAALLGGLLLVIAVGAIVVAGTGGMRGIRFGGAGAATTQTRQVPSFTGVDVLGSAQVHVRVGGAQSVVVRAGSNVIDEVTTDVRSGVLEIGRQPGMRMFDVGNVTVDVTVPALDSVQLTGSGDVDVSGLNAQQFAAVLPGSGRIVVSGIAQSVDARLSGSGQLKLSDLRAQDVAAEVSGSGDVAVYASQTLDAKVSGSGSIRYAGNPAQVNRDVSGSGSISPR